VTGKYILFNPGVSNPSRLVIVIIMQSIGVCHVALHKLLSRFGVAAEAAALVAAVLKESLVDPVLIPEKLSPVEMVMETWVVGASIYTLEK
jgi:hypothetical protein